MGGGRRVIEYMGHIVPGGRKSKILFPNSLREKSGVFFTDLTQKLAFFGVNFILQKFCPCKKNDKYKVCLQLNPT